MRFKVGDKVVYGTAGISEITDVTCESVGGVDKEYYVLSELGVNSDARTFVPTDSERLTSLMRPLISPDEARAVLDRIDEIEPLEWQSDARRRAELFRSILEEGDHERMIAMIKAIRKNGEERAVAKKKNFIADNSAQEKAERLIISEFSIALGVDVIEI